MPANESRCGRYAAMVLVGLALVSNISCGRRAGSSMARHVIVISLDTTRPDHFGFLGDPIARTPRLDAIAAESIVFPNCMSTAPTTLASHTSLFTGKYPHHHGTPRNGFMVNPANEMLAEVLQGHGFHTAGFAGSFALDSRFDFAQGFDHWDEDFEIMVGDEGADQNQRRAATVTDAVIAYLDAHGTPDRLFLFAHYFDPHQPYLPPAPFDTLYNPLGNTGLPSMRDFKSGASRSIEAQRAIALRFAQQYAAEIAYADHHIGRLLDDLRARGILDKALLVITSDHGENLWYHPPQFDHGYDPYQATIRALGVFRLPGAAHGGTRSTAVVSNIDVMPTILRHLGIAAPGGMDGEAIDLEHPEAVASRTRFAQATKPWREVEPPGKWNNLNKARCVREGRYKYMQNPLVGSEALFDLEVDPDEHTNLLDDPTSGARALAERLRTQLEDWANSANPLPSEFQSSQQEETIRRLKSLGYIN